MNTTISKAIMDKGTTTASYAVSGATAAGGALSLNEIALLVGIFFTVLTFVVNHWFKHRELSYKRRQDDEYHAARMAALKRRSTDVE